MFDIRKMYLFGFLVGLNLLPSVFPLLEEHLLLSRNFKAPSQIQNALVVHNVEEHAGVYIASRALVKDLEEITGSKPRNATYGDGLRYGNGTAETAIIVGTMESSLIEPLSRTRALTSMALRANGRLSEPLWSLILRWSRPGSGHCRQ